MDKCYKCPIRYFCNGTIEYAHMKFLCTAGFICPLEGTPKPVIKCPEGYYCKEGTSSFTPY